VAQASRGRGLTLTRPADIDPQSGFRLPLPRREKLPEAARAIYDRLADPKGGSLVGLRGPGGIRLHSPRLAAHMLPVNRYLRHEAGFSGKVRELAILVTARETNSRFEWAAHEAEALKEGVAPETVDIVRHRKPADGVPDPEATIIAIGRELFGDHRLSSATFARALKLFGARQLVDLVCLMGEYSATAALLAAFDIQLPAGAREPW
jgi:4-carboxymuconolactone decarboxylase